MPIRVLLADDHKIVREGVSALLEREPDLSVVATAADGRSALTLARHLQPDVAVIDIAMPDLDGIEATRRIREACPKTAVVVLSMYSNSEHVHRALRAGAAGYLLKESAGTEIVSAIRAVHSGMRYLSREIAPIANFRFERARRKSPLESLSAREREVLQLVVEGKSSVEIAKALCLSPKTVETYRSRLMQKLEIEDVAGLVKFAILHGIIAIG